MNKLAEELSGVHAKSFLNKKDIAKADKCGCFYCERMFKPSEITEWTDTNREENNATALCPYCKIDSVIPEVDGIKINSLLLARMHVAYFKQQWRKQ